MKRREQPPPWWSEAGPDHCEYCLQSYRAELGYYCVDCDRPVCQVCAVTILERGAVSCPECDG